MLWLWCRPEATAPTLCLAWEFPYAMDAALKRQNKQTNKQTKPKNLGHPAVCNNMDGS